VNWGTNPYIRTPPVDEGQEGDFIGPFTKSELDRAEVEKAAH